MGQISNKLAARFRDSGKYRRPIRELAKRIRESSPVPSYVNRIEQCIKKGLEPLHAAYAATQNFVSFFAEQVSILKELEPYYQIVSKAEDEYMPSGPPMSPLTGSYFTTWAFFDVRFGPDAETIGTCLLDTGKDLGMDDGMLLTARLMQDTRMGIYEHCGRNGLTVQLRELITGDLFACHVPTGYLGVEGELWYVRLCPPILDAVDYHIVLTTPYILGGSAKADWVAYLKKQLLGASDQRAALCEFLKYGPQPNHWNEFVFQAYHHHQFEAIFLAGLPDVQGSLPHASPAES